MGQKAEIGIKLASGNNVARSPSGGSIALGQKGGRNLKVLSQVMARPSE